MTITSFAIPLIIFALFLLIWSVRNIIRQTGDRRESVKKYFATLFISLLILNSTVCCYFLVTAGLGHSEPAKAAVTGKCLLSTFFIIVLPMSALFYYSQLKHLRIDGNEENKRKWRNN